AVGDGFTVMLDSTWAYQYPEALRVGKVAEELGFYWYEDPLADDDLLSYVKLKQHLSIPILATEYTPGGFTALAPWIQHQATDYLRGDPAVKGGITPLVKSAHLAEGFHMNFEIHHGGNSLNNVANLHVIMAIRNCEFFEVLLPAGAQKYGLAQDVEVDPRGLVHALNGPGLGADIDFALIERKKAAGRASSTSSGTRLSARRAAARRRRCCRRLRRSRRARGRGAGRRCSSRWRGRARSPAYRRRRGSSPDRTCRRRAAGRPPECRVRCR